MDRGEHTIEDELVFSKYSGYVFHDSRGFEAGGEDELKIVQRFIRQRSRQIRLKDRLHAIWYCIPMDNQRPELDLRHFRDIYPDKSVPVIAVFTKYDQFLRNVKIHLEDFGNPTNEDVTVVAKRRFEELYLCHLGGDTRYVKLEKTHKEETRCNTLLDKTVQALNEDAVSLMLLAVQRSNLELSVNEAVRRLNRIGLNVKITKNSIKACLMAFPQIWFVHEEMALQGFSSLEYWLENFNKDFQMMGWPNDLVPHVMSLPIMAEHTSTTGNSNYHLKLAIVLIFKHAALSSLSGTPAYTAITQAEAAFQNANTMSKIQEHFTATHEDYTIQEVMSFLLNTDIEPSDG